MWRELTSQVVSTIAAIGGAEDQSESAANSEPPAKLSPPIRPAARGESPTKAQVAPMMRPTGTMPVKIGETVFTPRRNSAAAKAGACDMKKPLFRIKRRRSRPSPLQDR